MMAELSSAFARSADAAYEIGQTLANVQIDKFDLTVDKQLKQVEYVMAEIDAGRRTPTWLNLYDSLRGFRDTLREYVESRT